MLYIVEKNQQKYNKQKKSTVNTFMAFKINRISIVVVLLFFATLFSSVAIGQVKIPNILSSNMVLQRELETNIWGWASAGEKISVSFRDQVVRIKADVDGKWIAKIATGNAGGPFSMVIKGNTTISLDNIMVGDVWVCSGQSNMEFQLNRAENGAAEARKANFKNIRLFQVQQNTSILPLENLASAQWMECNPQTVGEFSAVAYFFGKKIHTETGVPIGLISSNWGGTNIETWTSQDALKDDAEMMNLLSGLKGYDAKSMAEKLKVTFENYQVTLKKVQDPNWSHAFINPDFNDAEWQLMKQPGLWENQNDYENFDGIVWYRKTFTIPAGFNFSKAVLSLGMIDDTDIAWVNGKRVGETFNKYNAPRKYDIPASVLKEGKNQLVLRVEDYTGGGGIYGAASELYLTDGAISVDLSGDWKTMKDELPVPPNPTSLSQSTLQPNQYPTLLYNGMINPLVYFGIKGVIWYQGEANADAMNQALRYENQLERMIADWRSHWNIDFYFYLVQLANFHPETSTPQTEVWPFLREAQANSLSVPKTGMACIIDIGNANDIHPTNKLDVGDRLAMNALKDIFGKPIISNGPRFSDAKFEGNRAIITFSEVGAGLKSTNKYGYINGFAVAGADRVFHYAKASFKSQNSVVVFSDKVDKIESVRFLWANNPGEINLYNSVDLPAEPFRTDKW